MQQASEFRRKKQYKAAISIYQPLWEENPMQFNEWAGWGYAFSLKGMGLFNEALEVCRKLYPRFKHSEFISNLYAQCIYYTQIKVKQVRPLSVQRKAVKGMIRLSPPHREYSLSGVAIFKLCKNLMVAKPVPWQEIESWLNQMDPDLLSQDTFRSKMPNGKTIEYASQQEEWYSAMIRVKAGLEQPGPLIELLDEAKKKNISWHYQNDIWMKRKRAFAYQQLGQSEKAEKILREILRQKKDWFLFSDLGDILSDKGEKFKAYCQAALERGKLEMKINLFKNISELLAQTEKEPYRQHLLLRARIRMENGWPLSPAFEKKLEEEKVDLGSVNSAAEVVKKLSPFWRKHSGQEERMRKGEIDFLHKNGKSGMIKGDDGQAYFFGMSQINTRKIKAEPGLKVKFEVADGFDKKKNKPSKMAVNIKAI